ncbi:MAG: SPOR domain-containing protein [Candidatus Accumulibacter sp.]|jgi:cell division protein FtsN|nr:SPOR domain-containing protein [Accumulibacter sp.]
MSHDMKPRKQPRKRDDTPRGRSGGGTLLGLFFGLVIGVLAAAAIVWYIHRTPPPFSPRNQPPAKTAAPGTTLALPGKPGDPIPPPNDKPRFDFYKILPGNDEPLPESGPGAAKPGEARPPETNRDEKDALREPVFLQTGSFLNAGDADNQKAHLAMMGIEAAVQQVMLQDKVWYRVRVGPFRKIDETSALRAELARQGIDVNVVKKE